MIFRNLVVRNKDFNFLKLDKFIIITLHTAPRGCNATYR